MDIGRKINLLRKQHNMTQEELAGYLQMTSQNIYNYEKNTRIPPPDVIIKLCKIFDVSSDYLLGRTEPSNISPTSSFSADTVKIKIYGKIVAGVPCEAIEDIIGEESISRELLRGGKEFFGLIVSGESMCPEYKSGDVIICLKTPNCENNKDAIVMVGNADATLKRIVREPEGILLKPLNQGYKQTFYSNEEIENLPIEILGVVVELRRKM